jgi:23S rRNA-/tRNA-specific pseudouridylate synthase
MSIQLPETPRILRRRDGLTLVHKPSGLKVHPASEDGESDLTTWLAGQRGIPRGTVPVHRLDLQTSGIVLCSHDAKIRRKLSEMFAARQVKKSYQALVIGRANRKGIIRRTLSDSGKGKPREAVTRYRCVERLGNLSLLVVRPETGRRHQIRRHLQGIGLAVVGDTRYRPKRQVRIPAFPGRLWLHAWRIELPNGMVFEAPLPPALEAQLEVLREGKAARRAKKEGLEHPVVSGDSGNENSE